MYGLCQSTTPVMCYLCPTDFVTLSWLLPTTVLYGPVANSLRTGSGRGPVFADPFLEPYFQKMQLRIFKK